MIRQIQHIRHPGESRDLRKTLKPCFWPEIPAFAGMTALIVSCLILTACGVQRPLLRPKEIPAYEEQQRKKREKIEREMEEDRANAAKDPAIIEGVEPQQ